MHLPINIDAVLHGRTVESERVEFKKGWNPEAVLRSLCAFANDFHNLGGGYIFIGVESRNGRPILHPVGLDPDALDKLQKEIIAIGHRIQPDYHRGYDIREPVEVQILPDEVIITSQPGPDRSIRASDLKKDRFVSRRYRNRRIGEFLKELDLAEGRGTGIPKIMRAIRRNKSPRPKFETDEDRTYFAARFPIHPKARKKAKPTPQVTGEVTPQVTPQVEAILQAAKQEVSAADLQSSTGLKDRVHFLKAYLEPCLAVGWIERTIPAKPTSRFQKYRLTAKGRVLLEKENRKP